MDKVAIFSGAIGVFTFILSCLIAYTTDSVWVFIAGLFFLLVALLWKYAVNEFTKIKGVSEATNYLDKMRGEEQRDKVKEIVQAHEGDRELLDGAPTMIKNLCYTLGHEGVAGMHDYFPKNFMLFETMGIFLMEVEESPIWARPRFYAILSVEGPNAHQHIGNLYSHSFREAVDYISQLGGAGMVPAKLMEIRQPIMKQMLANAANQPLYPG